MKTFISRRSTLFVFTLISLLISGCKDDCKDTTCLNGGVCDSGDCFCPEGFTGDRCEDITISKLYGTYQCGGECLEEPPANESIGVGQVTIAPFPGDEDKVIIMFGQIPTTATISGNSILIDSKYDENVNYDGEVMSWETFSGGGSFTDNMLLLHYQVVSWYYYGGETEMSVQCELVCPIEF